jgi:AraC-like DNA-binding protein
LDESAVNRHQRTGLRGADTCTSSIRQADKHEVLAISTIHETHDRVVRVTLENAPASGLARVKEDVAAARDLAEAVALVESLLSTRVPRPPVQDHWSDELAAALAIDSSLRIADWAETAGLSREAVSRGFRAHYGTSPARFRTELRARSAWARISGDSEPLAVIAHDLGFADQAHMTRAVKWLTGSSPGEWRVRSPLFHIPVPTRGDGRRESVIAHSGT